MCEADGTTKPNNFEKRCQLVTIYDSVGRGGEIKFNQFSNWVYDARFELPDIVWHEIKVLKNYAMPMVPHQDNYPCNWFHSLASFWICEKGLFRKNMKSHVSDFLFPKLHRLRDTTIATNLTRTIRENLPQKTPEKVKKSFTSRLMRKGGIGELAMNPDIDHHASIVRSGHASGK